MRFGQSDNLLAAKIELREHQPLSGLAISLGEGFRRGAVLLPSLRRSSYRQTFSDDLHRDDRALPAVIPNHIAPP